MSAFTKWIPKFGVRATLSPRVFTTTFEKIDPALKVEEENLPRYTPARYYPVRVGQVFASRYQIDIYKKIQAVSRASSHPGQYAIRSVLDNFQIDGPNGEQHHCLVHPPLWETSRTVLYGNPTARFPPMIMATLLRNVFLALDFLHTECHLIHTDIKADNIVFGLSSDDPVLEKFEQDEIEHPSPRKEAEDGRFIYTSRQMGLPASLGHPVLCDFGSALPSDQINTLDAQPDAYRSPEIILEIPWDEKIDIWNVGCMVWNLCQGGHMFAFRNTQDHLYDSKYHLASIISLLGPPPPEMVARCTVKSKFFNDKGLFDCGVPLPTARSWESIETTLKEGDGKDREAFLRLMRKMIEWMPEKRAAAADLAQDEWIEAHRSGKV